MTKNVKTKTWISWGEKELLRWNKKHVLSFLKDFQLPEIVSNFRLQTLPSISVFVTKFACANLASKTSAENLLNSGVVIYLSWLWLVSFFSIAVIFVLKSVFLTNLLILGILYPIAVNTAFVAKPVILRILFSISIILAL